MRKLKIRIKEDGSVVSGEVIHGISGEGNATEIEFSVPSEYESFNKFLDISESNGNVSQIALSIKEEKEFSWMIPHKLTEGYGFDAQLVMKKGSEVFKSVLFAVTFEGGINATSYMESEYTDSIELLFETKAEKEELSGLEKKLNSKLSSDIYHIDKEEIKSAFEVFNGKLETKAEKNELAVKLSDLFDDSNESPVKKSDYAARASEADSAIEANNAMFSYMSDNAYYCSEAEVAQFANKAEISEKAVSDGDGRNISETYATKAVMGTVSRFPDLYDVSKYPYKITGNSAVCDNVIPGGSTVKSVKLYSDGGSSVNDGSDDGSIYLIRVRDNVCVYRKGFFVLDGWNDITVDYTVEEDCYFGIYNTKTKYTNSGVTDDYLYSVGIKNCYPLSPKVDDTVTITQAFSGNFALSLQLILADGISGQIADKVDIYQGENNSGKILTIGKDGNLTPEDKSPIYPHNGIISFIDDDTGKYVPDIWGEIIAQTNIRMGFACVTGYISGKETTVGVYEPMPLTYLKELYENGHEVYSHSYTHPDFASNSITLDTIDIECRKSRDWLIENGFIKNSDIMVYPGGMGSLAADKQSVVRQHYRYGIDTIEGGNLPEPIENPWCIYRYNADTRSLSELKALVDSAISEKKHLVFMNHAFELNKDKNNEIQKMVSLINYIKEQNGTILPFGEAVHKIYGWN